MQPQYGLSIVTAATTTPITIDEALAQLRVDSTDEFPYIRALIRKAVRYIEETQDRTLVNTVRRMSLDRFPCGNEPIKFPRSPVQDTTTLVVSYVDSTGGTTAATSQSVAAVPETDKHVIALLVSHWFENREPVNVGNIVNQVPYTVETLLAAENPGRYP